MSKLISLLCILFVYLPGLSAATDVSEIVVLRVDGEYAFIKPADFSQCFKHLRLHSKNTLKCFNDLGIDFDTLQFLADTGFKSRVTLHDSTGGAVNLSPVDYFESIISPPIAENRRQSAPAFSIERVHETSIISIEIVIKTDIDRSVRCVLYDKNKNILTVKRGYVYAPVDKIVVITGDDTAAVGSASCM